MNSCTNCKLFINYTKLVNRYLLISVLVIIVLGNKQRTVLHSTVMGWVDFSKITEILYV